MEQFIKTEIKAIVAEGAFGKNCNLVSFNVYNDIIEKKEWKYNAIFGDIVTSDNIYYSVLIKLKNRDQMIRVSSECDMLFHNELYFYEKIIPFLLECRGPLVNDVNALSLPRFFYGRNKGCELAEKDLIIFENVNTLGYRYSKDQLFIDKDHLIIALQAIAKFHGLSYIAKHKNADRFRDMVANVQDTQFDADGHWMVQNDLLKRLGKRGVDRLLKRSGERYRDHAQLRRLNRLFDDAAATLRFGSDGREPLSVLCHGDYCRASVMFQYDERGLPFDALIIDFFDVRYGSPALDLSLFLYTATTQRMRRTCWDELLDAYCAALAAAVPPAVRVPDRAELDAEMAASAIVGFARASFILCYWLRDNSDPLLDSVATSDDPVDYFLALGGDAGTECLADLVQHLIDMAYTQPCNAIGFHGLSYNAKHKDPGKFCDVLENVHNTQVDANGHWMAQDDLFKKCGKRGMDRLLKRDGDRYRDHAHIRRLNELFDDAENALMQSLNVREPLSVVCHGDWHRETLLFRYDEHRRPFDATAIDFSTLHYESPALDISSFLYMSTTQRVREAHWDDLLDTYCAALAASVPPGVRVPCRAEIDAEMADAAINGIAKASFALPFMLRDRSDTLDSLATSDDPMHYFLALGGDMATECLADIVMHLADMGYTDAGRDGHSDLADNTDSKYGSST